MKFIKRVLGLIMILTLFTYAEKVNVNFKNLEIGDFIKMVGKITGKNILIDGEIKGKINFVSNKPIDKSQLIPLANAILESKKMTLINQGDYYQVVRSPDAAGKGLPVRSSISRRNSGTMETVIFKLNSVNAAVIRTKIKPLLHKSAKVVSFKNNNLLAITAYPRTLKSVKKLIDKIEHGEKKTSRVVTLQNAYVKTVFPNILSMSKTLFPQDIKSEKVSVLKDESSNSIILIGNSRNINKLVRYIRELDVKGEDEDIQKMYVIPLQNSNVEEMEKILAKLLPQMTGNLGSSGSIHAVIKGARVPVKRNPRSPLPKKDKKVKKAVIASDVERNALIVLANKAQIANIRQTIDALDIEKAQVYIKAKIVEVNTDLSEKIGLKYGFSGGAITSKGVFSLLANSGAAPLAISGELMSFLNQGGTKTVYNDAGNPIGTETTSNFSFESGIKQIFSMGLSLDLLKQNGAAQILSEPSVLSTNNKESTIYVGRTQSILTQSQQSTQGSSNVLNNYSREDIGITLKVKPRLSSNNKVSLEVETTIEDILPGSGASADRPTTTKRSVKTNAIVNNAETIILGGLIKTSTGKSFTKIPILGDIPILGKLFTSQGEAKSKINVVIYLTPYIVKKSTDLVTLRKHLEELDSIQEKFNKIVLNKLEQRRLGMKDNKEHVTFSSKSKDSRYETISSSSEVEESPIIPKEITDDSYIESKEDNTIRSESILDTINQPNKKINLDQINTGIEYDEGTTFSD